MARKTHFAATGSNRYAMLQNYYGYGLPVGNLIFVAAATGTDQAGNGYSPEAPVATIDYAVGLCVASNDDVIVVMPGHTETITASTLMTLDVAGITILGLGDGPVRPTITLGTDATATITVSAANIKIKNMVFKSNVDSLAIMIDVNAGGLTMEDCLLWAPAAKDCLDFVDLATTMDDFTFRRCHWLSEADPTGTDGAANTGGVYLVDTEQVLFEDCTFSGYFETAPIHNKTTACKYLRTKRTTLNQLLTTTGTKWRFPASTVGVAIDHQGDATYYPGLGYKVSKTEDCNTATSDALFTLAGKVKINLWHCEVTNAFGAGMNDYKIELTTLAGILVAAGDISSAIIGFMRNLNGDSGDTMLSQGTPAVSVAGVADSQGHAGHLVVGKAGGSDVIKATRTAGAASDEMIHSVFWVPLEVGAYLVDAA